MNVLGSTEYIHLLMTLCIAQGGSLLGPLKYCRHHQLSIEVHSKACLGCVRMCDAALTGSMLSARPDTHESTTRDFRRHFRLDSKTSLRSCLVGAGISDNNLLEHHK
jgi:hypothetical protein